MKSFSGWELFFSHCWVGIALEGRLATPYSYPRGQCPLPSTPTKLLSGTGKIHATRILTQTALLAPALCVCVCVCVCVLAAQSCPTLCDPVDCSPPDSSVHGISQTGILEWVAISSSRGSSRPRDWTCISHVSCVAGGFFTTEPPGKLKTLGTMTATWYKQNKHYWLS